MTLGKIGCDACSDEHAAINTSAFSPSLDIGARPAPPSLPVVAPATGLSGPSPTLLPAASLCSEKHNVVLELFHSEGTHPAWGSTTKHCLPSLLEDNPTPSAGGSSEARKDRRIPAGLDADDDSREDFYDKVVSWWNYVNPAWRKEGLGSVAGFRRKYSSKKREAAVLKGSCQGLNGLTSVVACLWWWYRLAGVADATPRWTKLVEDVTWVLSEKLKECRPKRVMTPSEDEPPSKRVRVE
ncbi:hypothetical protein B0H14DRAFT_2599444 [Mycena olivaceomarginata]|nr:hypothetical protein B0H14DRAFT_2599444 [Mycena olivaceomarginata]